MLEFDHDVAAEKIRTLERLLDRRIEECQEIGVRLTRIRITPSQWATMQNAQLISFGLSWESRGFRYRGYPLVVNWSKG